MKSVDLLHRYLNSRISSTNKNSDATRRKKMLKLIYNKPNVNSLQVSRETPIFLTSLDHWERSN